MQLEYGEMEDSYSRARQVGFQLPAKSSATPHRDPVLRILDTPPDGSFICCSQDGLITFWSPGMLLRRCKSIVVSAWSLKIVFFACFQESRTLLMNCISCTFQIF